MTKPPTKEEWLAWRNSLAGSKRMLELRKARLKRFQELGAPQYIIDKEE